jgi:hypothetical protein
MNAEEIRQMPVTTRYGGGDGAEKFLRELVAQLADLNESLKELILTLRYR